MKSAKTLQPHVAQASKPAVPQHLSCSVNGESMVLLINQGPGMNAKGVLSFSPGLRAGASRGTPPTGLNPERVASVPHSFRQVSKSACRGLSNPRSNVFALIYSCGYSRPISNHHEIFGLNLMPFGNSELESKRDSIVQPRVATEELPWVNAPTMTYPNWVASSHRFPANLNFRKALGLMTNARMPKTSLVANVNSPGWFLCFFRVFRGFRG